MLNFSNNHISVFMSHSSRGLNPQRWLDAFNDLHSSIYTFSQCMTLADINADGDSKLIVADLGTGISNIKLKVRSRTCLLHLYNWFYKSETSRSTCM
jgi:hypothetical protein